MSRDIFELECRLHEEMMAKNDACIFIISYGLLDEFARFRQGRDGDGHQEAVALLAREVENMP